MRVQPFETADLPQLMRLVNLHLAAAIPGWALSEAALARHLERDDAQPITDPWVEERITLCAVEGYRVLAAAHLLRYGDGPEIGPSYRGVGEIAWVLARPERADAAASALAAAGEQLACWGVRRTHGWGSGLPAGPLWGVPDVWPHVVAALETAGYRPSGHREALYGGWLAGCDRIVLSVGDDAEAAGAGRFYRRFGWDVFVRETHGWRADGEGHDGLS